MLAGFKVRFDLSNNTKNLKLARRPRPPGGLGWLVSLLICASITASAAELPDPPPSGDVWAPFWIERDWWQLRDSDPARQKRLARHTRFLWRGLPHDYQDSHNPLSPSTANVREGGALYLANCGECHGETGMGDGDLGLALTPSPALLSFLIETPSAVDGYLLWAISDGGAPFGTDMPSFKDRLGQTAIWKIITYMRAGFPKVE